MDAYKDKVWERRDENSGIQYVISTKRDLLDISFIQSAFAGSLMPWAKELPEKQMDIMLNHSTVFGLYRYESNSDNPSSSLEKRQLRQIGFARIVTDYATFAWITDVFVLPECQGAGLGRWMLQALDEVLKEINEMGTLRRSMLITSSPSYGVRFYGKELGMKVQENDANGFVVMTTAGKTW